MITGPVGLRFSGRLMPRVEMGRSRITIHRRRSESRNGSISRLKLEMRCF